MKKNEEVYQKLSKQYSDEEIADAMLIPADLTVEEQAEAYRDLKAFRFKLLSEMTEEQRIYSDLLRFRYQLEHYLEEQAYDKDMNFGNQLGG